MLSAIDSLSMHDDPTWPPERAPETTRGTVRVMPHPSAIPWLLVTYDELRDLPLGPKDGFVLSLIDGRTTIEMIFDLTRLPADETHAILARLLRLAVIALH